MENRAAASILSKENNGRAYTSKQHLVRKLIFYQKDVIHYELFSKNQTITA